MCWLFRADKATKLTLITVRWGGGSYKIGGGQVMFYPHKMGEGRKCHHAVTTVPLDVGYGALNLSVRSLDR